MDRHTRDKFASATNPDPSFGNACWETAPEIFAKLQDDFGPFDIDLTADAERALLPKWFGPGSTLCPNADDALWCDWQLFGSNGYSNPPYGPFVPKILHRAIAQAEQGFTSTLLLPMRVTAAFRAYVLHGASELLFCDQRLIFYENGQPRFSFDKTRERMRTKPDAAMFDSIIVRYKPRPKHYSYSVTPSVGEWHVPDHGKAASTRRASWTDTAEARRLAGCE